MKIIVLDIETTGWLNKGGLIVEIGALILDLNNGETTPVYDQIIKEDDFNESHKDSWIFNNSSLTWECVNNTGVAIEKELLQDLFNQYPVTAYNKAFDLSFLRSRGFVFPVEFPCPMITLTPVMKLPSKLGYSGFKWPSVIEATKWLFPDKEYDEEHRGLSDAIDEAKIIYYINQKGWFDKALQKEDQE